MLKPAYPLGPRFAGPRQGLAGGCAPSDPHNGNYVRFPDARLHEEYGLLRLGPTTKGLPWAKGMIQSESRMRENRTSGLASGRRKRY